MSEISRIERVIQACKAFWVEVDKKLGTFKQWVVKNLTPQEKNKEYEGTPSKIEQVVEESPLIGLSLSERTVTSGVDTSFAIKNKNKDEQVKEDDQLVEKREDEGISETVEVSPQVTVKLDTLTIPTMPLTHFDEMDELARNPQSKQEKLVTLVETANPQPGVQKLSETDYYSGTFVSKDEMAETKRMHIAEVQADVNRIVVLADSILENCKKIKSQTEQVRKMSIMIINFWVQELGKLMTKYQGEQPNYLVDALQAFNGARETTVNPKLIQSSQAIASLEETKALVKSFQLLLVK